jgi:hypothetical protein
LQGEYVTAVFYGCITYYAFPDTWQSHALLSFVVALATSCAIALGTYLVGTLGPRQCSFTWPLIGALLGLPFLFVRGDSSPSFNMAAFFSCLLFEWKVDWNANYFDGQTKVTKATPKRRRHIVKRCLIFGMGALVFCSILSSAVYQNLQVDINGERVKIKDVLWDFFKSQEFIQLCQQLSNVFRQIWAFYQQFGFKGMWTQIWSALDLESDKQAFEVSSIVITSC